MKLLNYSFVVVISLIILLIFQSCVTPGQDPVYEQENLNGDTVSQSFNSNGDSIVVATWNLRNLGNDNLKNLDTLKNLIVELNCDIYCFQEIASEDTFFNLVSKLSEYNGILSDHVYSWDTAGTAHQKTGILYKTGITLITKPDLKNSVFTRWPFVNEVSFELGGEVITLTIINLHFKANTSPADSTKRKLEVESLKLYVDSIGLFDSTIKFVIAGDWNAVNPSTDPLTSLYPFYIDSLKYQILTAAAAAMGESSHFNKMIDHIIISKNILENFSKITTHPKDLNLIHPTYYTDISDHKPVVAVFRM